MRASEQVQLLDDSVTRMFARAAQRHRDGRLDRALWTDMHAAGLLALPFAAADGGLDGGMDEIAIVMERIGATGPVIPWWSTTVLAGGLVRRALGDARDALLARMIDGAIVAVAQPDGRAVVDAADADAVLVLHDDGVQLIDPAGIDRHIGVMTLDGRDACDLDLSRASAAALDIAPDDITEALDDARIALCAEAIGAMGAALMMTQDHVRARHQFGAALGSFQAVRHRMVDMYGAVEGCRSLLHNALTATEGRARAVAALKARVPRAGRTVVEDAIQLHGGMGMTEDLPLGRWLRRMLVIDTMLGSGRAHLARFAAMAQTEG